MRVTTSWWCCTGPGRVWAAVAVQQGRVAAWANGLCGLLWPGLHDAWNGLLHVLHHRGPLQPRSRPDPITGALPLSFDSASSTMISSIHAKFPVLYSPAKLHCGALGKGKSSGSIVNQSILNLPLSAWWTHESFRDKKHGDGRWHVAFVHLSALDSAAVCLVESH